MPSISRRFSSQSPPSSWLNLASLKKTNLPNTVEVNRGEVVDIYKKAPSGKVLKSVEHRFASVPEHVVDIKTVPPQVLEKLGINSR